MASRETNLSKYEFFATKEGGSMFSDLYRASDYQNSWPKNYHELHIIRVVKREKLSSTIMKNLNKLKLNDSWC